MTAYECLILLPVLSISLQYPLFPHLQPDTGSDNGLKILLPCYSRPLSDLRSLHPIHPWQVLHLFSSRTFPVPSDLDLFPYRDIVRVYSEFLLSVFHALLYIFPAVFLIFHWWFFEDLPDGCRSHLDSRITFSQ